MVEKLGNVEFRRAIRWLLLAIHGVVHGVRDVHRHLRPCARWRGAHRHKPAALHTSRNGPSSAEARLGEVNRRGGTRRQDLETVRGGRIGRLSSHLQSWR